jgi:tetratricopeptide (TPR) repeat protein
MTTIEPGRPGLFELHEPAGSRPIPPAFAQAVARFAQGKVHYEAGRPAEALADFLRAAGTLHLPPGSPYADIAAANRRLLYRNAGVALQAGADPARAAPALREALAGEPDPECRETLQQLLDQ